MNKIDDLIGRALTDEDRALLAQHSEPGYFTQALGLFRGPTAWVMWIVNAANLLAFVGGLYAIWRMFGTVEAVTAIQWGVLALFLFQVTTLSKTVMASRMEANRLVREIKRLELQVSLLSEATAGR